jgi:hypothetical protein
VSLAFRDEVASRKADELPATVAAFPDCEPDKLQSVELTVGEMNLRVGELARRPVSVRLDVEA